MGDKRQQKAGKMKQSAFDNGCKRQNAMNNEENEAKKRYDYKIVFAVSAISESSAGWGTCSSLSIFRSMCWLIWYIQLHLACTTAKEVWSSSRLKSTLLPLTLNTDSVVLKAETLFIHLTVIVYTAACSCKEMIVEELGWGCRLWLFL